MVILHIAFVTNDKFSGVNVAVPAHIKAQANFAEVGFINITNWEIDGIPNQMQYTKKFDIKKIKRPFNEPDIVVFHECYRVDYIWIANNLRRYKIPYIIVPHGELRKEAQKKKYLKKSIANFLLFNRFSNKALAIQCLSDMELKSTAFGKEKFIGTNGVEIPVNTKKEFHRECVKFIYVGRYEWRVKGLDILLDAIKSIEGFMRENNCSVDMYGPDTQERYAYVRDMIFTRKIEDIVKLHHEITGEEKERKLLDADIFIQTSRHEGMPMGILEALSYGIPCLVTQGTNLDKAVEGANAGWGAATNAQSVAETIKRAVYDRNKWGNMKENAANFIKQQHSWNYIAKDAVKQYEELIERYGNKK